MSVTNITSCVTLDCLQTASLLLHNMDDKIDPCQDFHSFACGHYIKNNKVPSYQIMSDTLDMAANTIMAKIAFALNESIKSDEPRTFVLAKTFYQACMNETAIEARGIKPLIDLLRNLGGWPVVDGKTWNPDFFKWDNISYRFRKLGLPVGNLISLNIIRRQVKGSTVTVPKIEISRPTLGLKRKFLKEGFGNNYVKGYFEYMVDIATLLGANRSEAQKELHESLKFEMSLAEISMTPKTGAREIGNSIASLIFQYPKFPWLDYINAMMAMERKINGYEFIVVKDPDYILRLVDLINKTPVKILANYVMWRVAKASVGFLTDVFVTRNLAYLKQVKGRDTFRTSRWQICTQTLMNRMPYAVDVLFIKKIFTMFNKPAIKEMVELIRNRYKETFMKQAWMDKFSKNLLVNRLENISAIIVSEDFLANITEVDDYYSKLVISSDKFLESSMNLTVHQYNSRLSGVYENSNQLLLGFFTPVTDVNAWYDYDMNLIDVAAGVLEQPTYAIDRPSYINYGALGSFISHELGHAVDNELHELWNKIFTASVPQRNTARIFYNQLNCLIKQYSNYAFPELNVTINNRKAIQEIHADNIGIKLAYQSYKTWAHKNKEEPRIPGFENYTPKQMFWLSAASMWCHKYTTSAVQHVKTDVHPPHRFRIIGPFSNMKSFAADFNCPVGSVMNPAKKCNLIK